MEAVFFVLLGLFVMAEIIIAVRYVKMGKSSFVLYTALPSILYVCYLLAICLFRINVPYLILMLSLITVFLHTYFGLNLDLYHRAKYFDRCLHCFGSFSFALLIYMTLSGITAPGGSVAYRAVFVAALGITAGAAFEIIEFVHDKRNKTKLQRGLTDTDYDIIFDFLGSVAASILAAIVYL